MVLSSWVIRRQVTFGLGALGIVEARGQGKVMSGWAATSTPSQPSWARVAALAFRKSTDPWRHQPPPQPRACLCLAGLGSLTGCLLVSQLWPGCLTSIGTSQLSSMPACLPSLCHIPTLPSKCWPCLSWALPLPAMAQAPKASACWRPGLSEQKAMPASVS